MRDERGSVTPLVAVTAVLLLAAGALVSLAVAYAAAQHRVRGVADLAAVAGAEAYGRGTACEVAARSARANGARVKTCRAVGDWAEHVVTVDVAVAVGARFPGLPTEVSAVARAGRLE
ncbi:hypothetical protein GCM10027418_32400 [Mariniluteicoccus endophyticus]